MAQVVAHVRVIEHGDYVVDAAKNKYPYSMLVEVVNPARNAKSGEILKVLGGNVIACGQPVSIFPPNTEWVLALSEDAKDSRQGSTTPRITSFPFCSVSSLAVKGNRAYETIYSGKQGGEMPLRDVVLMFGDQMRFRYNP